MYGTVHDSVISIYRSRAKTQHKMLQVATSPEPQQKEKEIVYKGNTRTNKHVLRSTNPGLCTYRTSWDLVIRGATATLIRSR